LRSERCIAAGPRVALSPDWEWAAVVSVAAGAFRLALVRLDGSAERRLGIHVVGSDGQRDVLLAGGPGAQLEPKWSPTAPRSRF